MRIAFLNLTGGGISGGHKKYLVNMLPRLEAANVAGAVLCASPASVNIKTLLAGETKIAFVECEPFKPFRHYPPPALKSALNAFKPELLFIPIERYINYKDTPVVVMLQNMAPLAGAKTGKGIKEWLVSIVRRYETRYALKRAAAIIVPTVYVKDFLVAREGIAPQKIFAINYGNSPAPLSPARPAALAADCNKFIFTAGSMESYRGVEDLVRALPAVKRQLPGIKLVVAGGTRAETEGYQAGLKKTAVELGVQADIFYLGNIGEAELSWCYANCAAFALTSKVESFCFVALEAMAHGCSIISTDSACLPEVLGDAAVYYKAGDAEALARKLIAELSMPRAALGLNAMKRAVTFSWDTAAAKTLEVFTAAAAGKV